MDSRNKHDDYIHLLQNLCWELNMQTPLRKQIWNHEPFVYEEVLLTYKL